MAGANPEGAEDEGAEPDARTWRRVTLRMVNDAEGRVDLRLLRPDAWFEENDVEVGGTVHLEMVELGAVGPAEVLEIGPCPPIQPGEGGVVTGTFASEHTGELAEIAVEGLDEPIRCTPKHRFWSEDRQAFIPAEALRNGETLRLADGRPGRVTSQTTHPAAPTTVHNLEIHSRHVYAVSQAGVLVHNTGCGGAASNPASGRVDFEHSNYDDALVNARRNAGDLGENTQKMYDPETGTLLGERSADRSQGWRIDEDHVNWWDWSGGKKGKGGEFGHEFFPPEQAGPHSKYKDYAPWED